MEIITSPSPLTVFYEDQEIGRLTFDAEKDEFLFDYDLTWVKKNNFIISPHITPDKKNAAGVVNRFLENLLPEGEGLMQLAQMLKVNRSNLYSLILAIGGETTGALAFIGDQNLAETKFRKIEKKELETRIKNRFEKPIANWDGKPRLSLAGVQEKLAVVIKDDDYGLGDGNLASTHILKFGHPRTRNLVLNEFYCMQLAKTCGIKVADCELIQLGERVLQVKRFDRKWQNSESVKRYHLIDGCQALDLRPAYKYERFLGDQKQVADITGPATLQNIYKFCENARVPAKDQLSLLQWTFFNLLIGNCDHHIKNVSFFIDKEGISLAPFYDLVCVTVYPDLEQALAFHIGDTFDLKKVNAYHFAEMASELGLKKNFVAIQLKKLIKLVQKNLNQVAISDLSNEENKFLDSIKEQINERSDKFLKEADQIKKFKSI